MASKVVTHSATHSWRTSTSSLRRIKSHEPGQRVMTEAIAFLFTYYAQQYPGIAPSVEEFFAYTRNLSLQTYHVLVPLTRRQVGSRMLGGSPSSFETLLPFLDFIEPCRKSGLVHQLIQAQNIGLRALVTYIAFVDDDSEKMLKTHIVEPYVWYSSTLFHDLLDYKANCIGAALRYIQDGVVFLLKSGGKRRLSTFFDTYDLYKKSKEEIFVVLYKYLVSRMA